MDYDDKLFEVTASNDRLLIDGRVEVTIPHGLYTQEELQAIRSRGAGEDRRSGARRLPMHVEQVGAL